MLTVLFQLHDIHGWIMSMGSILSPQVSGETKYSLKI